MKVRCSVALSAAMVLVMELVLVHACGPDWMPDAFVRNGYPDDMPAFAAGRLGILQMGFDSNELAVAYRYLNGGKLSDQERAAYVPQQQTIRDWTKLTGEQIDAERAKEKAVVPSNAWRTERDKYAPAPQEGIPPDYGNPDSYYDPTAEHKCPDAAFQTAKLTLEKRAETWGHGSQWLVDWIHGQDAVFANCAGKSTMVPAAAPAGGPTLLKIDRAYQRAAAAFYAGDFDAAREQFEAIGRDAGSPWHSLGGYLAARALVRKAFSMGPTTDPWSGDVATFDMGRMKAAQQALESLLKDRDPALPRHAIQQELNLVRIRTEPEQRVAEICAALAGPGADDNFGQDLKDLDYALFKKIPIKNPPPLLSWIRVLRGQGATDTAVDAWRQQRTLPWLVVAMMHTEASDRAIPDLLAAAAQVRPDSPAFDTVTFHRIRLLTGTHRDDEARALLDQLLPELRRKPADSRLNAFLGERMAVARDFDEFLKFAPRTVLEKSSAAAELLAWACNEKSGLNHLPYSCPIADHPLEFQQDSVLVLNRRMPLAMLARAATSPNLPPHLQQDVTLAAWTRSVLLEDAATAKMLAPHLPEAIRKTAGTSIGFPAMLALLRNPGLRPYLEPGISHLASFNNMDHFRNNWWCDDWWGQFAEDPWAGDTPDATFLTPGQRAAANKEYQRLRELPCAAAYLGEHALAYARQNPSDPDIPEALARTVQATHWACLSWNTKRDDQAATQQAAARNTDVSKAAFRLLHSRYPQSPWTAKTKYYY